MLVAVRTGILGGTFDPIHIAHLHSAECTRHQLGLDRVLVMPAGDPWQKAERAITSARERVAMCRLAVEGVDGLEVDDRETHRDGPTHTIDTLGTFPASEELFLIVGADAAAGLSTWHRWEEILERVTIAIVPRPGTPIVTLSEAVVVEMGALEVSGTDIRVRAREGRPFRYLVTRAVHEYIVSVGLYAEDRQDDMVG
jgi:nicotinate-nucleotide adenylyltransferase